MRIIRFPISFFLFLNTFIANAQSSGIGISVGALATHLFEVPTITHQIDPYGGALTISGLNTSMALTPEASIFIKIKVNNWLGISSEIGLIQNHAHFNYHLAFIGYYDPQLYISHQDYDDYKSEYKDTYINALLRFDLFVFNNKRFYLYAGIRPEILISNSSSDTYSGHEITNYGPLDSTTDIKNSGMDSIGPDYRWNLEILAGGGMVLGKTSNSRFALEIGGYQGLIRYSASFPPSLKRNGLEMSLRYILKKL